MATLREYFDTDSGNTIKIYCRHNLDGSDVELVVLCDFSAYVAWVSCYVTGERSLDFFIRLVQSLQHGQTKLAMGDKIVLPASRTFPGDLRVFNQTDIDILVRPYGNPDGSHGRNSQHP